MKIGIVIIITIKPVVILKENTIEINKKVSLYSLIKEIKFGTLVTNDYEIDTSKLGVNYINIQIKKDKKIYDYDLKVEIVDTVKPVINTDSNIYVNVYDNINLIDLIDIKDNSNLEVKTEINGFYDITKIGVYKLLIKAVDSSLNEETKEVNLNVVGNSYQIERTKNGYSLMTKDGISTINGIIIVNKSYPIAKSYGTSLTKEVEDAFNKMQIDAKKDNIDLFIKSGFRSYDTQVNVYNNWVNLDGKEIAETYSARPGYSEHQTGLALDLNLIEDNFKNSMEFKWLQDNCYKYGFILRYPENKQDITGYIYEPWHYRYVGENLAKELYNNSNWITLEEYFGIDSKYR